MNKTGQSRLWLALPVFFYAGVIVMLSAGYETAFDRLWTEELYDVHSGAEALHGVHSGAEALHGVYLREEEMYDVHSGVEALSGKTGNAASTGTYTKAKAYLGKTDAVIYDEIYVFAEGVVEKCEEFDNSIRFTIKDVSVRLFERQYKVKRLFVYTDSTHYGVIPGSSVSLSGTISRLKPAANPGQFDALEYYKALGIKYYVNADYLKVTGYQRSRVYKWLFELKERLRAGLVRTFSGEDLEVLSAMLLGDRTSLDDNLKSLYQFAGIAHLLTISGLHISLIGRGIYRLLRRLAAGFILSAAISGTIIVMYGIMTGLGTSSLRAIIMFIIFLAAECLGKSYDMASALCLSAIMVLCEYPLMLYQFAFLMSVSCILSIALVSPLVIKYLHIKNVIIKTIVAGVVIQWCTMPVLLYFMYVYPSFAVLLNLAVIPFASLVMVSGFSAVFISELSRNAALFSSGAAHYILLFYKRICELTGNIPFAQMIIGRPAVWKIAVYYIVLGLVMRLMSCSLLREKRADKNVPESEGKTEISAKHMLEKKSEKKASESEEKTEILKKQINEKNTTIAAAKTGVKQPHLGYIDSIDDTEAAAKIGGKQPRIIIRFALLMFSAALCFIIITAKNNRCLTMTFADVGQGDSILVQTPNGRTALIDCGSSSVNDVGLARIIPMLNFYGIKSVDCLFLSHADTDHINGADDLILSGRVKSIILPDALGINEGFDELIVLAEDYNIPVMLIGTGESLSFGDTSFTCLNPGENDYIEDANGSSMVLKLECRTEKNESFSVLFTGDLDMAGEERVMKNAAELGVSLDCDVLKVGHHGSKYSSGEAFLESVRPEAAVISCSENNTYGHPAKEALERLYAAGARVYVTKECGAVILICDNKKCALKQYKRPE
ncbi:MAG: ComEC/Rec2 family competence protein [Lachnospiraceae bacterium]|nr:ComEC/Rec2 family competence protein [Lachnospiraceae bacterium]